MRTSVEHHHTVLLRTAEQLVARTLGDSFHKHFIRFTDATLVGFGRQTVLQSDNLVQATDFHLFGHIIFEMLGRIRSRTSEYLNMKAASYPHSSISESDKA